MSKEFSRVSKTRYRNSFSVVNAKLKPEYEELEEIKTEIQRLRYNKEQMKFVKKFKKRVLKKEREAAVKIQKHIRGYLARKKYSVLELNKVSTSTRKTIHDLLNHTKICEYMYTKVYKTIKLQSVFRRFLAKIKYKRQKRNNRVCHRTFLYQLLPEIRLLLRTFICKLRVKELRLQSKIHKHTVPRLVYLYEKQIVRIIWNKFKAAMSFLRMKKKYSKLDIVNALIMKNFPRKNEAMQKEYEKLTREKIINEKRVAYGIKQKSIKCYEPIELGKLSRSMEVKQYESDNNQYDKNSSTLDRKKSKFVSFNDDSGNKPTFLRRCHHRLPTVAHKQRIHVEKQRVREVAKRRRSERNKSISKNGMEAFSIKSILKTNLT